MREDADKIVVDDEIVVEKNSISSIDFEIEKEINKTIYFEFKEDFYCYFKEIRIDIHTAIEILIRTNTICSMFVLVQIFGNKTVALDFNWEEPTEADIKAFSKLCKRFNLFGALYSLLYGVKRSSVLMLKSIKEIPVQDLSFMEFREEVHTLIQRQKKPAKKKKNKKVKFPKISYGGGKSLYDKYEHGMSDW